ncbi:MAG: hypothetical protein JWM12_1800 [Ilumatobacteraceae bacterium]|jgi:hypothetical protein|nr:hypothetical protein [Ilumatobacteraceae bacterium]
MSIDFLVRLEELFLLDEREFYANGGETLAFGAFDADTVGLHAEGTRRAITCLARHIVEHHTASH